MNLYLQMGSNHFNETRYNESLLQRPLPGTMIDQAGYERDVAEVLTAIARVPFRVDPEFTIPAEGSPVPQYEWRSSGIYFLGQQKLPSPVRCMYLSCAQNKTSREYFTMKILNLKDDEVEILSQDDIQGMFLMHNEYMILNRLSDKDGVYKVHDYFKELYAEEVNVNSALVYSGRVRVRICLVLDYVAPNDMMPECKLTNLQHYVLEKKVLTELEAARIFREILSVVKILHSNNIVHRDLKLSNIMFDKSTLKVTLVNFELGQYLPSADTMIRDQRGSPAYISPDILTAEPYAPMPSDMWSLGISFYVMLMGSFPFYDIKTKQLFDRITRGSYMIPLCGIESFETAELIKGLLAYNPEVRIKVDKAITLTSKIINCLSATENEPMQIVPDYDSFEEIKMREADEYRWKFSVLQRGNRLTLRQDPGCQVPILHLTSDEKRVRAIEMKRVRGLIVPTNNSTTIGSQGIFNGNLVLAKPNKSIVDQIVPEVVLDEREVESSSARVPQRNRGSKRLLRSNNSMKNVNIRSLLN